MCLFMQQSLHSKFPFSFANSDAFNGCLQSAHVKQPVLCTTDSSNFMNSSDGLIFLLHLQFIPKIFSSIQEIPLKNILDTFWPCKFETFVTVVFVIENVVLVLEKSDVASTAREMVAAPKSVGCNHNFTFNCLTTNGTSVQSSTAHRT